MASNLSRDDRLALFGHGSVSVACLLFGLPPPPSSGPAVLQILGRWHGRALHADRDRALAEAARAHGCDETTLPNAVLLLEHAGVDLDWIAREAYGRDGGIEESVKVLVHHTSGKASTLDGYDLDRANYEKALPVIANAFRRLLAAKDFLDTLDGHRKWADTARARRMEAALHELVAAKSDTARLQSDLDEQRRRADEAERVLAELLTERAAGTTGDEAADTALDAGDPVALGRALVEEARQQEGDALATWRRAAAVTYWTDSVAALEAFQAIARLDPDDLWAPIEVGLLAKRAASLDAADAAFAEAEQRAERAQDRRHRAVALVGRAAVAADGGALGAAADLFAQAAALLCSLADEHPDDPHRQHDLSVSFGTMGAVRRAQGDLERALEAFQDGLDIAQTLSARDPANTERQRDLAISFEKIGDVRVAQGDLAGALDAYQDSLAIAQTLSARDPANTEWQRDLAISFEKIGDVLVAQGDLAGALEAYQDSLAIARTLAARDPANTEWQRDLSVSFEKIGDVRVAQGDLAGALEAYQDGLAIARTLAARDPANTEWQRDLSVSFEKIGDGLRELGGLARALEAHLRRHTIAEALAKRDPTNAVWRRDLGESLARLAAFDDAGVTWADVADAWEGLERDGLLAPVDRKHLEDARRRAGRTDD